MIALAAAGLLVAVLTVLPAGAAWFSDITAISGIPALRHGEGVVAVDINGDKRIDLYLPCVRDRGRLLLNRGDASFEDVTVRLPQNDRGGVGAAAGDLDGDGRIDLYVARGADPYVAPNLLFKQNANGAFSDASDPTGVAGNSSGLTVTLADFNGDGRLDAFLPGWGRDVLFNNAGDKGFVDRTAEAGLAGHRRGWVSVASDFNGDGAPDLFVSHGGYNLPQDNRFYLNRGGGTFLEATGDSGLAHSPWSMGAVSADFDADGDFDLYVAGYGAGGRLYRNEGNGRFTDVTAGSGLTAAKAVGAAAGPIDGDLLPDLVIAGFAGPVQLFRNLGQMRFAEVGAAAGFKTYARNEGMALADFDDDGDLDLYVANVDGHNRLYNNCLDNGRFLKIRLVQSVPVITGTVAQLSRNGQLLASQELAGATGMGQGPGEFLFRLPDDGPFDLAVTLPGGRRLEKHDVGPGVLQLP